MEYSLSLLVVKVGDLIGDRIGSPEMEVAQGDRLSHCIPFGWSYRLFLSERECEL